MMMYESNHQSEIDPPYYMVNLNQDEKKDFLFKEEVKKAISRVQEKYKKHKTSIFSVKDYFEHYLFTLLIIEHNNIAYVVDRDLLHELMIAKCFKNELKIITPFLCVRSDFYIKYFIYGFVLKNKVPPLIVVEKKEKCID